MPRVPREPVRLKPKTDLPPRDTETVGLSPKVIPAIFAALAGAVVTIVGALNGDTGTLAAGLAILGTGSVSAGAGAALSPGRVRIK